MPDIVRELFFTEVVIEKLGRRSISAIEARQLLVHHHVVLRNRPGNEAKGPVGGRKLIIGRTSGGRYLTLVVEPTVDPTDWLVVTGWDSANHERRMVER